LWAGSVKMIITSETQYGVLFEVTEGRIGVPNPRSKFFDDRCMSQVFFRAADVQAAARQPNAAPPPPRADEPVQFRRTG
jgi:hypothetical protein